MNIISPLATGNGAHVIHKALQQSLKNYHVVSYNPWLTLFPPILKMVGVTKKDIECTHTTPDYAVWSMRDNKPLIVTFHNYILDPFMQPYSSFLQKLHYKTDLRYFTRRATESATKITAVSQFTAKLLKEDLQIKRPVEVILNGIDEKLFFPLKKQPKKKKIKVLFSGNLTQRKGVQWLIPITELLNEGVEIDYTQGLRTKIRLPEHPKLHCIGSIEYKNMPNLYRQYDILLSPTVREGLPMAVMEAMGCGLPVIATDCSSLPELIDEAKGGHLCPLGDVLCFAEKINLLADSHHIRTEMGEYNRSKVESHFTLEKMVAQYRDLFSSL